MRCVGPSTPAGVELPLKNGTLTCEVRAAVEKSGNGKIAAEAKLADVKFTDGTDLFVFDGVSVAGATIDSAGRRLRIDGIDIVAPPLPRVDIGRFTWKGTRLKFDDQAVSRPASLALDDTGV